MTPYYSEQGIYIYNGDCRTVLATLDPGSVQTCVTSPPYWGLRDYGHADQIGLEATPEAFVDALVAVFRDVRRCLRDDGTLWLNLGDSYASASKGSGGPSAKQLSNAGSRYEMSQRLEHGLKEKDLVGIPWRVAFALQADGWYLRQDIIWHKPNPMPESVTDRCTKAHEYVFLLAKSERYFYDADAIAEPSIYAGALITSNAGKNGDMGDMGAYGATRTGSLRAEGVRIKETRNRRSVWTVTTKPYAEAHFATFPADLILPCILAGTSARGCCPKCRAPWERVVERVGEHGYATNVTTGWQPTCACDAGGEPVPCTVLDPFLGSGTTAHVARKHQRRSVGIELSEDYCALAAKRLAQGELFPAQAQP
jgi:DNA modification methylase